MDIHTTSVYFYTQFEIKILDKLVNTKEMMHVRCNYDPAITICSNQSSIKFYLQTDDRY